MNQFSKIIVGIVKPGKRKFTGKAVKKGAKRGSAVRFADQVNIAKEESPAGRASSISPDKESEESREDSKSRSSVTPSKGHSSISGEKKVASVTVDSASDDDDEVSFEKGSIDSTAGMMKGQTSQEELDALFAKRAEV